jgi:HlyD family secretion protein
MDRPIEPAVLAARRRRRIALAGASLGALCAAFTWGPGWLRPSVSRGALRLARVERGPIEVAIGGSGSVVPEAEQSLASPVEARVLRVLVHAGDQVAAGQPLLELDLGGARLAVDRLDRELALKRNQSERTRLDLAARLNELGSLAEVKRLQLEGLRARLARQRELHTAGLLADETLRESELLVAQTEVEQRQLETGRAVASQQSDAQHEGLRLEAATLRGEREEAARALDLATARAGRAGVVSFVVGEEGATVRKGDVLARVADLSAFRVNATASDLHAARIQAGLPAVVRVDGHDLRGQVASVSPAVKDGAVSFEVALEEKASPLLRPSLRVEVRVVLERREALRLPRGPYLTGDGASLFVVQGERAVRRPVRLGAVGADHVEVLEGLAEGEQAVISDLAAWPHARELRLAN